MASQVRVTVEMLWSVTLVIVLIVNTLTALQMSFAVGGSKVQALVLSTVLLVAQFIVGLVVSTTVTF